MFPSRPSVVVLSRGSTWSPNPWDPPYTLPNDVAGGAWPGGATAQAIFYDNAGGQLATVTGTVTAAGIAFTATPTVMDLVPNGANFEVFVTVSGAPYQIRYGKVIRREAQFTQVPESVMTPLAFTDSWPTIGLRAAWIVINGSVQVWDNSSLSLANGIQGANLADSAIRWYKPLATDTVSVKVDMVNRFAYTASFTSIARIILCSNVSLTSCLGVEFNANANGSGTHSDQIQFFTITPGASLVYRGTPINNVVANNDQYTAHYDDPTKTLSVYKGTNTTPLGSWADSTNVVPHGPGYRYLGVRFTESANNMNGLQFTSWQAIDTV